MLLRISDSPQHQGQAARLWPSQGAARRCRLRGRPNGSSTSQSKLEYEPGPFVRLHDTRVRLASLPDRSRTDRVHQGPRVRARPDLSAHTVVVNVTAVGATTNTHFRVYPNGQPPCPTRRSSTSKNGDVTAALVTVPVGTSNGIRIYNANGSDPRGCRPCRLLPQPIRQRHGRPHVVSSPKRLVNFLNGMVSTALSQRTAADSSD